MSKENGIADEWKSWTYFGLLSILSLITSIVLFFLSIFKVIKLSLIYLGVSLGLFIIFLIIAMRLEKNYLKNKPIPKYIG